MVKPFDISTVISGTFITFVASSLPRLAGFKNNNITFSSAKYSKAIAVSKANSETGVSYFSIELLYAL